MRKLKCPKGHVLPHKVGRRECTPLKCGGSKEAARAPKAGPAVLKAKAKGKATEATEAAEGVVEDAEEVALLRSNAHGTDPIVTDKNVFLEEARKARESLVPKLVIKEGEDPVDATLAHTARLLPSAAQQVEYQLLYGDARGRFDAALALFDQHGIKKKESVVGGSNTIILNVTGGSMRLPWQKAPNATVDAGAAVEAATREVHVGARRVGELLPVAGERESGGSEASEPDAGGPLDV